MEKIEDNNDQNITKLFENAKNDLLKIEWETRRKKKEIILKLASSLEGKIQEDMIAREIIDELKDIASESFILQCLPEKYKQKYQVNDARKQRKKVDGKLAKESGQKQL